MEALQARICGAGSQTWALRVGLAVLISAAFFVFFAGILMLGVMGPGGPDDGMTRREWLREVLPLFAVGIPTALLFAVGVASVVAGAYRRLRRAQLTDQLRQLSRERAAEVLLPLRARTHEDIRKIVDAVSRDLRLPSELTPAPTPAGRGSELSASGEDRAAAAADER